MKVLVIGGSGKVGTLTVPHLAAKHDVRVFDLRPPSYGNVEYVEGSAGDYEALLGAIAGMDALLYMAMGGYHMPGRDPFEKVEARIDAFDVNVKGVHLALFAAHKSGIGHAVYTSSMSVYRDDGIREGGTDEETPPDSNHAYGLTKRLGEEVCRSACRAWGMSINALRLCFPMSEEDWLGRAKLGEPTIRTTGEDVARALLSALEYRDGFQAFTICGDYEQKLLNIVKAKRLLEWEPLARPIR